MVGEVQCQVGIHAHNGADVAVANSLAGVEAGATHVQGAANGYGDMCGNANMFSIIANLKLKIGIDVVTDEQLARLTEVSHYVSEIANIRPNPRQPYVGSGAFAHKAGLHAAAVVKEPWSYQHVDPMVVGNDTRFLVSELAGRRNIVAQAAGAGHRDHARPARRDSGAGEADGGAGFAVRRRGGVLRDARPAQAAGLQAAVRDNEPQGDGGARRGIDPRTGEREYIAGVRMTVMVRKNDREWKGHADHEGVGPGRRARQGAASFDRWAVPGDRFLAADGLQGPHHRQPPLDGGDDARAHRIRGRRVFVVDGRHVPEHHRGEPDGAGGQLRVLVPAVREVIGVHLMIVTTTHEIQGKQINDYLGIVVGETILATNIFRDIGAGLRDIVGGRSGAYEKKMVEAREIAIREMEERAQALGADAVVGVDIDYDETVGNGMMMVSASGTAVRTG